MTDTILAREERHPKYVNLPELVSDIDRFLLEDIGAGDVTTSATIPPEARAEAHFLAKQEGILAGVLVAELVFERLNLDLEVRFVRKDGDRVRPGDRFGFVEGNAAGILKGERLALNLMQRMSGIATATSRMAVLAAPAAMLDTRKTVPGLRPLDKWAVLLGGGKNHRIGLYDMVLVKDNHIAAAGGISAAVDAVNLYQKGRNTPLQVEVEARTLDEVQLVAGLDGVDWILLDNMVQRHPDGSFDVSMLREAVGIVDGRKKTEASGNVTEASVGVIASTGVDAMSSGALTHSVKALDISLKIEVR